MGFAVSLKVIAGPEGVSLARPCQGANLQPQKSSLAILEHKYIHSNSKGNLTEVTFLPPVRADPGCHLEST